MHKQKEKLPPKRSSPERAKDCYRPFFSFILFNSCPFSIALMRAWL